MGYPDDTPRSNGPNYQRPAAVRFSLNRTYSTRQMRTFTLKVTMYEYTEQATIQAW